ncbi:MAG: transglycosylase SLT domain-containing protein, partial [Deltaproteobacteria bacterium]|nr:transglycosylase SLT domain-containing protein [Deltaproteobacteria bacterium]
MIEEFSKKYGVDSALVKAVIQAESGFNSYAVSRKGAKGLMQLMP